MKTKSSHHRRFTAVFASLVALSFAAIPSRASELVVDDFSDPARTHGGAPRFIATDKEAGGQSQATESCAGGVLKVEGEIVPGRGMPGFISVPLLLAADAKPQDLSAYQGVVLRVKLLKGSLSVQVGSSEIQNFDYHTSAPLQRGDGFQEVRIAFKDLKRAWSEQIPLNPKTITSVNLVAFGLAREPFAYEVKQVAFY